MYSCTLCSAPTDTNEHVPMKLRSRDNELDNPMLVDAYGNKLEAGLCKLRNQASVDVNGYINLVVIPAISSLSS